MLELVNGDMSTAAIMLLLWYFAQRNAVSKGFSAVNLASIDDHSRDLLYTLIETNDVLYIIAYILATPFILATSADKAFMAKTSAVIAVIQLAITITVIVLIAKQHITKT